jgi:hypothetical protein
VHAQIVDHDVEIHDFERTQDFDAASCDRHVLSICNKQFRQAKPKPLVFVNEQYARKSKNRSEFAGGMCWSLGK